MAGMTEEEYKQCLIQLDLLGVPKGVNNMHTIYLLQGNTNLYSYPLLHRILRRIIGGKIRNITKAEFDDLLHKHIGLSNDS